MTDRNTTRSAMKPLAGALLASMLLAGCAVGPDYQRPAADLPQAWPAAPQNASQVASRDSTWWKIYADPALDKLVEEALARNADLAIAAARITEAEAQLGLARTSFSPTTYADGGRGRSRTSAKSGQFQEGMPLETTSNRAALNISYELDFWGKYRRTSEAARAELLATEAARDTVRQSLIAQVVQGHYNLVALDARVAATERTVQRGREALALLTKQFDAGMISRFELQQRSAEVDAVTAQLPPLQRDRAAQERALAVLLGRPPRDVVDANIRRDGDRANATTLNLVAPAGLPSELLLSRPDLREAEQRLVAANARIGVARAAYFPSITLTGAIGSESAQLSDLFSGPARTWNFAGNITQALWGAGRLMREEEIAEARQKVAVEQYRNAVINAFREVQDAVAAQAAAREVFVTETRRVESLKQAYALARLRFENGVASQLDVIDNERGLIAAEHNRIEAERALRAAIADLYRALGTGGEPAAPAQA